MAAKTIRQTVTFPASPSVVYDAYMDSKTHTRFTGAKAKISVRVGGAFMAHGGYITGKNLALIPKRKIVQEWRGNDWKPEEISVVEFNFQPVKSGTKMKFVHRGVPEKHADHIRRGWYESYWEPLKAMLSADLLEKTAKKKNPGKKSAKKNTPR